LQIPLQYPQVFQHLRHVVFAVREAEARVLVAVGSRGGIADHGVAEVQVGDKTLFIIAHNNSAENMFIQSVRWNGMPYDKSYIDFKDLQQGGTLEFEMGAYPSETFGVAPESRP
jgi:hypothetical protein